MKTFDATPKASILIESMRDIGYNLETAIADLIDNSITANARQVEIFAEYNSGQPLIGILDDGDGMSNKELLVAMRPGSMNPLAQRDSNDLGRFGLGLKTASFSQCRRLTVLTRKEGVTSVAVWDLDHVAKVDRWEGFILENIHEVKWAERLGIKGTLVVWDKMDRLTDGTADDGQYSHFNNKMEDVRNHLQLVYHRYLSGEVKGRPLRILLNHHPLEPFDPFCIKHTATLPSPPEQIRCGSKYVEVIAYTIPNHSKVTTAEWEYNAGREGYMKNQGFYIYRNKRLIIHGTWFGLAKQMEITKLARVKVDIPGDLDSDWKIDVRKASAQLPPQVKDRLRRLIAEIQSTSKRIHRGHSKPLPSQHNFPVWLRFQTSGVIGYQINPDHPVISEFSQHLGDEQKKQIHQLFKLVSLTLPVDTIYHDMCTDSHNVVSQVLPEETIIQMLDMMLKSSSGTDNSVVENFKLKLHSTEPFYSNWKVVEQYLNEWLTNNEK